MYIEQIWKQLSKVDLSDQVSKGSRAEMNPHNGYQ